MCVRPSIHPRIHTDGAVGKVPTQDAGNQALTWTHLDHPSLPHLFHGLSPGTKWMETTQKTETRPKNEQAREGARHTQARVSREQVSELTLRGPTLGARCPPGSKKTNCTRAHPATPTHPKHLHLSLLLRRRGAGKRNCGDQGMVDRTPRKACGPHSFPRRVALGYTIPLTGWGTQSQSCRGLQVALPVGGHGWVRSQRSLLGPSRDSQQSAVISSN